MMDLLYHLPAAVPILAQMASVGVVTARHIGAAAV